jgi:hypothetical protein
MVGEGGEAGEAGEAGGAGEAGEAGEAVGRPVRSRTRSASVSMSYGSATSPHSTSRSAPACALRYARAPWSPVAVAATPAQWSAPSSTGWPRTPSYAAEASVAGEVYAARTRSVARGPIPGWSTSATSAALAPVPAS